MARKIPNTDPPQPPVGSIAAKASDGWAYVIHGGDPVIPMPPIPQVPRAGPAGVVAIGSRIASTNFLGGLAARHRACQLYNAQPDDDTGWDGQACSPKWLRRSAAGGKKSGNATQ